MSRIHLVALAFVIVAPAVAAAQEGYDPYGLMYGDPIDVSVMDLAQGMASQQGRPVRTRGHVELYLTSDLHSRQYSLRDGGYSILLVPRPEIAGNWEFDSAKLLGARVQIVGLYQASSAGAALSGPAGVLEFWKYVRLREEDTSARARARVLTLQSLTESPKRYAGALVRVLGEFRGHNLFGDLPAETRREQGDWVIKDEAAAVWVTGKTPSGSGFSLDPTRARDSGKWLDVVARVEIIQGTVYLRAVAVDLGARPERPAPTPVEAAAAAIPKKPPVVVFSLPLDGERDASPGTGVVVQFSNDMDEASFAGRVRLGYVDSGPDAPPPFPRIVTRYDPGRRALTIDPGDRLDPGRELELALLPGIKDVEGLELVPREGSAGAAAIDVLRFAIAP